MHTSNDLIDVRFRTMSHPTLHASKESLTHKVGHCRTTKSGANPTYNSEFTITNASAVVVYSVF
jgi:hypothetical protein